MELGGEVALGAVFGSDEKLAVLLAYVVKTNDVFVA